MRAVVFKECLPIDHPESLVDMDLPDPVPGERDVLVRVEAISVNPVDFKIRAGVKPDGPRVLGWDAVGVVEAVGSGASLFEAGERVWYAGELNRPGTNSELQCVDERLISLAPTTLPPVQAAALPLTAITAWELLFERLRIVPGKRPTQDVILVSGAAGGVGSILLQLVSRLTAATVIATAGRAESEAWVRDLGADHVVDYREPLAPQLAALGHETVTHVVSLTHTDRYYPQFVEILAPFGQLALIDDPPSLDVSKLKARSLSLVFELMFTRSLFKTNMESQGRLLGEVAALIDSGVIRTTVGGENFGTIDAANLKRAHALLESGKSRGKIVLAGFQG